MPNPFAPPAYNTPTKRGDKIKADALAQWQERHSALIRRLQGIERMAYREGNRKIANMAREAMKADRSFGKD